MAAVRLVPISSQANALRGLIPEGWIEVGPGTFARMKSPDDQAYVIQTSLPKTNEAWLRYYLMRRFLLSERPTSIGDRQTPTLRWKLYAFDDRTSTGFRDTMEVAAATSGGTLHIVALQAIKEESDTLHRSVFLPIVDSVQPMPVRLRDKLTAAELSAAGTQEPGPVNNAYFTALGDNTASTRSFEGTLTVPPSKMYVRPLFGQPVQPGQDIFPGFAAQFFSFQSYLVPVQQEILPAGDTGGFWKIILSPGKVWSEPEDGGLSRAAFPFVLVADDSNETHNGLATFLFDDSRVTSVRFQIVQETAAWNRFDAWGQIPMDYAPGQIENRKALETQFAAELKLQIPVHPWSELEQENDPALLSPFYGSIDPADISATGLIVDGTIYLQPCFTRFGEFPYCEYMRHGAFSVTKSMGAAVAMLRLAQKYGEGVFDLKLSDYVQLNAAHDGWKMVTFGDALNQATGIGDDPNPEVADITSEETGAKWQQFASAKSAQEKLDVISTYGKYPWGPGKVARYNSTNTFVLSVAMDRYLKSKEGPLADVWDMVLEEVYKPIGIYHAPIMRTIEPDGSRGVPIFGYGLYPTVEDAAQIALLLRDGGQYHGRQLLHAGKLAEAMQKIKETGLPTGILNGGGYYHLSFWSEPCTSTSGAEYIIPYMSGFGGNRVVFNSNGVIAFRFTDATNYELGPLVKVAEVIGPFK